MPTNFPVIPWSFASGGGIAQFTLPQGNDKFVNFYCAGSDITGNYALAKYCVVDNTGNVNSVTVNYNGFIFNIPGYQLTVLRLAPDQLNIQFISNGGATRLTFTTFDPGISDQVDQLSIATYKTGAGSPTVWNANDKSTGTTLSADSLTATHSLNGNNDGVRAVDGKVTGKFYIEFKSPGGNAYVGIVNASKDFAVQAPIANPNNGFAIQLSNAGSIFIDGVSHGNTASGTWNATAVMAIAVDLGNKVVWARMNSGLWNDNAGADPAAGTGGIAVPDNAPWYPYGEFVNQPCSFTANFGATAFAFTPPTGFTAGWK